MESASIGALAEKEVIPEVSNELALHRAPVKFQAPFSFVGLGSPAHNSLEVNARE
jgi:hypothetical protein